MLAYAFPPLAPAQVVNRPPVPEWISAADSRPNQPVTFQKEFLAPATLLKSVLLGATEGTAEVSLNGVRVGEVSGAVKATGFDVTGRVKPGQTNVLSVRVLNATNAASLAVLLELNADLARQSWLISDATWRELTAGLDTPLTMAAVATASDFRVISLSLLAYGVQLEEGDEHFPKVK